jgi:DNA polymerase-3 subunit gamma/tau
MVGQEHVLQALINALDHDRLHHAYLFTGTRGVGKTTIARILARCLNCEAGVSSEPCGECSSCLEISEGRSIDLIEVDAASRTKVEDTRELLENVQYAPTKSRYKVYLIDEVHMLSGHSFNALLKTLEEPPPHVKFLFATTDPQKLPATVLSRCLQFNLKNMPPEQIVGHLAKVLDDEVISFDEPALWLLGRAAAGSMRDALSLTDQAIAFGSGKVIESDVRSMLGSVDLSYVYKLLESVSAGDVGAGLETVEQMSEHGADFQSAADELLTLIHRVAIAQAVPDAIDNSWGDAQRVAAIASTVTAEDAQLWYQLALNGKRDLEMAPEARTGFEMLLLRMVAFRPAAVIDDQLTAADLQDQSSRPAVQEGGEPVKKSARPEGEAIASVQPSGSKLSPASRQATVTVAVKPRETAPDVPAVPRVEEVTVPTGEDFSAVSSGNWWQVVDQLGLTGIVHSIASNCCIQGNTGSAVTLVLDERNSSLLNDTHANKISLALENFYGEAIAARIEVGQPLQETPAMRSGRLAVERQQQAVSSIQEDQQLQALILRFDGELDQASIQPIDS